VTLTHVMRRALLLGAWVLLGGCSSIGDWLAPAEIDPPAALQDITEKVRLEARWQTDIGGGAGDLRLHLVPHYVNGRLYVADADGRVMALDADTGRTLWSVDLEAPLSGGPGAAEGLVVVGTLDAEVIALSADDGSLKWRTSVSSEELSTPVVALGRVVVHTIDGKVQGLDADTGEERWRYEREIPVLTLRGTADPVASGDHVLCGMAGGKLVNLDIRTGDVRWEATVAVPRGRSELERLADIDGNPLVIDGLIYVVTYQGEVAAVEESSGSVLWRRKFSSYSGMAAGRYDVYASDANGFVWALDADSGAARWRQEVLKNRQLSDVAALGDVVIVGDFDGYLHLLSAEDGALVGRGRVGSDPITHGVLVADGRLFVMGDGGELAALQLVPVR